MYKPFSLILALALLTGGSAAERADEIDSMTPSSAVLLIKTSRINDFVVSFTYVIENLLSTRRADSFMKEKNAFRDRTGIDPLDLDSLKKAGVDVERRAGMAIFPDGTRGEERMALFMPVLNVKTFPLAFVDMIKKAKKTEDADIYPAITEYRGYTVHQIGRDIFSAAFDGVFVLASTGELLRKILDTRADNAGYLALDPRYKEWSGRGGRGYDLRVFATREFLKEAVRKKRKKESDGEGVEKKGEGPRAWIGEGGLVMAAVEREGFTSGASLFNAVDYAFLGASARSGSVKVDVGFKFNETSATVTTFLDILKTGMTARSLRIRDAATYSFLSLDFAKIEDLCRRGSPGCRHYQQIKEGMREDLGIDFQTDLLPYYNGVLNLIAGPPKGAGGGYLIYIPMEDASKARALWEKSSAYLKKKYEGTGRYGTGSIGEKKMFWYIDSKNNRNHAVCDARGLYLGNDTGLIDVALSSPEIGAGEAAKEAEIKLGDAVFFFTRLKKESFFGALLSLYSYRNDDLRLLVEKMTDLVIVGEKADRYLSIAIDMKLAGRR